MQRLENQGCICHLATTSQEACKLVGEQKFDLVLSQLELPDRTVYPLIDRLAGSPASLYYSQAVEDGCWWLPAIRWGKRCFGVPALRPSEFIGVLDKVLTEIASGVTADVEPVLGLMKQVPGRVGPEPREITGLPLRKPPHAVF
jgi:hypothetical protein